MIDIDNFLFNIAVFIGALFILENAADKFVDHTAKLAARLQVPPTLVALLTAGAEWEELAVVVAAIVQHQSPLAMGNILGSFISNIIGAFALGLIFSPGEIVFDTSSKTYTAVLLVLTSLFALYIVLLDSLGRTGGILLIITFAVYITSIGLAIYRGIIDPPKDDGDSDSDSDIENDVYSALHEMPSHLSYHTRPNSSISLQNMEAASATFPDSTPYTPESIHPPNIKELHSRPYEPRKAPHSTLYHVCLLIFAVFALSLSGYILSHSITTLAKTLAISNSLLGITLLSFATTLPEKLVAVFSGARSQSGVLVANTAGSNIFLITLCVGVLFLAGDLESLQVSGVTTFEILWMWGTSVLFFMIVMIGGNRWMGFGLLALYFTFIVCEFTLERR
ncbi:putative membrane protein [Lachnellula suecica]|uniref:Putative membrane protein n=1 Tax=Lachnellula suecica TaxID=602035 RepID=A0A8T9C3X8_9HELO|nr:putative membrane protein [Lachnellula suecica]